MNPILIAIIQSMVTDGTLQAALLAKIKEGNLIVRTATEEEQYKKNLIDTNKEEIIKEEKKIWMRRIEDDVKELTGIKQNPSEPYHEFMKRGFKAMNEKIDTLTREKEAAMSGKDGDSVWKTKYETLETQSKAALLAKDTELQNLQKSVSTTQRRSELDKVFAPIQSKFIDQLPSFFNDYKEQVIQDVLGKSAVIDGKLVLVDENGNPRKDTNLNNISVESHLAEKFKDVIKPEVQQPGSGTQPPKGANPPAPAPGTPFNVSSIPADVTTQGALMDHLGKQGLLQGTPEFDTAFATAVKEKNITKVF